MGVLMMRAWPLRPSRLCRGRRPCVVSLAPVSFLRPSWIQPGSPLLFLLCTHSGQPHVDLQVGHTKRTRAYRCTSLLAHISVLGKPQPQVPESEVQ